MPLAEEQDYKEADVSLISGALRRQCLNSEPETSRSSSSVVLRNQTMTVANTNSAGRRHSIRYIFKFIDYNLTSVQNLLVLCLQRPFWLVEAGKA